SSRAQPRDVARLLVPQQLAEPNTRAVQARLQRSFLEARDLVDLRQAVALDVVQREQCALLAIEPAPGSIEILGVEKLLGELRRARLLAGYFEHVNDLHRSHVSSLVAARPINEHTIHHPQQPTSRLLET